MVSQFHQEGELPVPSPRLKCTDPRGSAPVVLGLGAYLATLCMVREICPGWYSSHPIIQVSHHTGVSSWWYSCTLYLTCQPQPSRLPAFYPYLPNPLFFHCPVNVKDTDRAIWFLKTQWASRIKLRQAFQLNSNQTSKCASQAHA